MKFTDIVETKRDATETTVVAADDDPIVRQLLESKLAGMGCTALMAEDGQQAWQLIRATKPDLAIVDLDMPVLDGFELIELMRSHPRTKHLPIIVVTGRTDHDAIQRAFASGATSFLTKPVHWGTFESHLRYLMRLTQAAARAASRERSIVAAMRVKDTMLRRALATCNEGAREMDRSMASVIERLARETGRDDLISELTEVKELCGQIERAIVQTRDVSLSLCEQVRASDEVAELGDVIEQAMNRVADAAQRRGVPIVVSKGAAAIRVACGRDNLAIALAHLLENAVRHSPKEEPVRVETQIHEDQMLTISVIDNGEGMEPEYYAACLGSFSEATDPDTESTGIGLPLSRAVLEALGGNLEIRSMPGQGTTAMLVVPADRVESPENESASAA